jgi:protein-tyrosine-phosphatase
MGDWIHDIMVLRRSSPRSLLFLCVANSARSQMAEGIARSLAPASLRIASAGSLPSRLHPEAVAVLAELDIDISGQRAKPVAELVDGGVDAVITLCAEESCPAWLGDAIRCHWPLADPAGTEDEAGAFRAVRDELQLRLAALFAT